MRVRRGEIKFEMTEGVVASVRGDTLFLHTIDSMSLMAIPISGIRRLEIPEKTRAKNIGWGITIGVVCGGILGAYAATDVFNEGYSEYRGAGILVGGTLGATIELLIGLALPAADSWKQVPPRKILIGLGRGPGERFQTGHINNLLTKSGYRLSAIRTPFLTLHRAQSNSIFRSINGMEAL